MSNPSFKADYAQAVVYPAHSSNYHVSPNDPHGWVLHTPEEPADNNPYTPRFFADPNRQASTHYFVSFTGKVYQCVPERFMAIANGVIGRPYPKWADPNHSLNRQSLSVEIEGYAASLHTTMRIGGDQWNALVALVRDRARFWGFPTDRQHIIGHYEVANNRSDPGAKFPWDAFIAAVNEGGHMPTPEYDELMREIVEIKKLIGGLEIADGKEDDTQTGEIRSLFGYARDIRKDLDAHLAAGK